ncbi:zinc metalloproteinase nas-13-like [Babylonia areolata]|uniref:zinc metalloproteinase nas-13-like n=1 Tax=Babylonia areolata TaxID=304850 RepID=UPI003FD375D3
MIMMMRVWNMFCTSIYPRLLTLAWLHLACLFPSYQGMAIDQIIANAMSSQGSYGHAHHESSHMIKVELDMVFSMQDWMKLTALNNSYHSGGHSRLHKRQAIWEREGSRYWPGGIIFYEIDPYVFEEHELREIHEAMQEWMRYTCIQFRPATRSSRNTLRFVDGDGCSSNVGMVRNNRVTLARGCRKKHVVLHELGHALGFHHEQTRPDRDRYVRIHLENIPPALRYNFRKYTWAVIRDLGVEYDYLSIMHYSKLAFSARGDIAIETLDKRYQDLIGNRKGLSFRDIKSANFLYSCKPLRADCRLKDEDCPREGFLGKDCVCWCPNHDIHSHVPYYVCQPGDTTATGGRSVVCEDKYGSCEEWAARGACSSNKPYMLAYCERSCGFCTDAVTSPCLDEYEECRFWRHKGYCEESSHFRRFMTAHCNLTCGLCSHSPAKVLPCEQTCENQHEHCEMWAWRGECSTTPEYMHHFCRKACRMCCKAGRGRYRARATRPLLRHSASMLWRWWALGDGHRSRQLLHT